MYRTVRDIPKETLVGILEQGHIRYIFDVLEQGLSTEDNFLCRKCGHFHYATSGIGQCHVPHKMLSVDWNRIRRQ